MMLCLCLIVGATFALFGKQSAVDIAVTSGDIAVNAEASGLVLYSAQADPDGTLTDEAGNKYSYGLREDGTFVNGGTAQLSGGTITIDRIAPGDMAEFEITVTNRSNIDVKYRTILSSDGDLALIDALEVTIGGETYGGNTVVSDWTALEAGDGTTEKVLGEYLVSIAMPMDAEGAGGLSASISFEVEAVQGNAVTSDPEEGVTYVYNKTDLYRFAQEINAGSTEYRNTTLRLMSDIDLGGTEWTPIRSWADALTGWEDPLNGFVLDGQGHTIYNMTISDGGSNSGFFGSNSSSFTIKNLTFDGTYIKAQGNFVGTVIGYQYGAVTLENVHAVNGVIDVSDCVGIRIGGLVGFSVLHDRAQLCLRDCSVENYELYGYHNVSGLVGTLINYDTLTDRWSMTGCTVKDVTIYREQSTLKHSSAYTVNGGPYPAFEDNEAYFEELGNTSKNVQIFYTDENGLVKDLIAGEYLLSSAQDLQTFAAAVNAGKDFRGEKVVLTDDISLAGIDWTPIGSVQNGAGVGYGEELANVFRGSFDGNGHTISDLTVKGQNNAGFFGVLAPDAATVENVKFTGAVIEGEECAGVLAGAAYATGYTWESGVGYAFAVADISVADSAVTANKYAGGAIGYSQVSMQNITVTDTDVSAVYDEAFAGSSGENDSGENAGAVVGDLYDLLGIDGAQVSGCAVSGVSKIGGVAGSSRNAHYIRNCTVTGVTMQIDESSQDDRFGWISGRAESDNEPQYTGNSVSECVAQKGTETVTIDEVNYI